MDDEIGRRPIKVVRRVLADGTTKEYRYDRTPKLPRQPTGALRHLFNRYVADPLFARYCGDWQVRKEKDLRLIEAELGHMTVAALEDVSARQHFYALRDKYADQPFKADRLIAVLGTVLAWAYDRGMIRVNHCTRIKPLAPKQSRHADKHLTAEQEEAIVALLAPDELAAFEFALYTGLRVSDLCALPPSALGGDGWLTWRPSKTRHTTNVEIHIPVNALPPLKAVVDRLPKGGSRLLMTAAGEPWSRVALSMRWHRRMATLGFEGLRWHDIRHTTSTRLVMAGCTEAERAMILGHATSDGIGATYTARVRELSLNAYRKWWRHMQGGGEVVYLQEMRNVG